MNIGKEEKIRVNLCESVSFTADEQPFQRLSFYPNQKVSDIGLHASAQMRQPKGPHRRFGLANRRRHSAMA